MKNIPTTGAVRTDKLLERFCREREREYPVCFDTYNQNYSSNGICYTIKARIDDCCHFIVVNEELEDTPSDQDGIH